MTAPEDAERVDVICGDALYQCRCVVSAITPHDVHVCSPACGGSWRWADEPGVFDVVTLPKGVPAGALPYESVEHTADGVPFRQGRCAATVLRIEDGDGFATEWPWPDDQVLLRNGEFLGIFEAGHDRLRAER